MPATATGHGKIRSPPTGERFLRARVYRQRRLHVKKLFEKGKASAPVNFIAFFREIDIKAFLDIDNPWSMDIDRNGNHRS
jgi:hypothetical protein